MKIAFIVQRYGREILGGSETLARQLAERLARRHEITVLTTTAKDYITWKNEYEAGEEKLRGVRVHRFPVEGERDIEEFNRFSEGIYKEKPTREQELEWLDRQGPVTPELIEFLKKEHERFDLLLFFTYLYYPTYYGLQVAPEKSVLLPTAHDEPPLRLGIFKEMFQLPSSFLFNTEAEELLVLDRFGVHKKMRETVGVGVDLLDQPDPSIFRKRHNISAKYFLYAGRIDGGKNLEELFRFFSFYKEEYPASGNLQLILIGKLGMKLPEDSSIRYIGFVDEAEKLSAMAGAIAVMQPSKLESFSIVTLEAFSVGTPVVVNGASRVLVDHCLKSNAGFYYRDFEEFEEIFNLLFSDRNLARSLGKNGQRYIKENYGWQTLLAQYEHVFRASARPPKEPKESRRREPSALPSKPEPTGEEKAPEAEAADAVATDQAQIETVETDLLELPPVPEPATEASAEDPASAAKETAPAEEAASNAGMVQADAPSVAEEQAPEHSVADTEAPAAVEEAAPEEAAGEAAPVVEDPPEEPRDEPTAPEEEVPEEIAHLPSFFQSSVRPRPVSAQASEPEAAPKSPAPPPTPAPPIAEQARRDEEGGLPAFFQPRSKKEEVVEPTSGDAAPEPSKEEAVEPSSSDDAPEPSEEETAEPSTSDEPHERS
ncbi:MAG: glycosyltransferase [Acidobacteria bacterium]|nr:MAG: glycosyltransferase [Acidobacteriota bacterium]